MRFLSVCSGIEAASCAWHPIGWQAVAFAEIDAFSSAVLAHRFPGVPNWGDLNRFREWPDAGVDVLVGGTPCQSFSVAGLRAGLADPRGNLALTYIALAERCEPDWLVWENVPGVFSAEGGDAFRAFLSGLVRWDVGVPAGGWRNAGVIEPNPGDPAAYGVAWRVLDAQYFGVPQRRRRVFLVGYLGAWEPAAAVLFEPEGMRGDRPPSRETGEGVAPTLAARTRSGGGLGTDAELDGGLIPEVSPAVTSKWSKGTGGPAGDEAQNLIAELLTGRPYSDRGPDGNLITGPIAFDETQITHPENRSRCEPGAPAPALATTARPPSIAFNIYPASGQGSMLEASPTDISNTLDATAAAAASTERGTRIVEQGLCVRRLTPRECERLQGFPDDWTLIDYRGRPAKDSPRYRAIGNSMAVPVMRWIGERIEMVAELLQELTP